MMTRGRRRRPGKRSRAATTPRDVDSTARSHSFQFSDQAEQQQCVLLGVMYGTVPRVQLVQLPMYVFLLALPSLLCLILSGVLMFVEFVGFIVGNVGAIASCQPPPPGKQHTNTTTNNQPTNPRPTPQPSEGRDVPSSVAQICSTADVRTSSSTPRARTCGDSVE